MSGHCKKYRDASRRAEILVRKGQTEAIDLRAEYNRYKDAVS